MAFLFEHYFLAAGFVSKIIFWINRMADWIHAIHEALRQAQ